MTDAVSTAVFSSALCFDKVDESTYGVLLNFFAINNINYIHKLLNVSQVLARCKQGEGGLEIQLKINLYDNPVLPGTFPLV